MSVLLETTLGEIVIDLEIQKAPRACTNFLKLCKTKYFNFSLFHNVQKGYMTQTGKPAAGSQRETGESVWGIIHGSSKKYFLPEFHPKLKHSKKGAVSFVTAANNEAGLPVAGSQFFITLSDHPLESLDGKMAVFGYVAEGLDILDKINQVICDEDGMPYKDIRIKHTIILDDPFEDPEGLVIPDRSPLLTEEMLRNGRLGDEDETDETRNLSPEELERLNKQREADARALTLEMVGDLPFAEIKPPENVLFVCKLNSITKDEDLEIIFSRFGKIVSCEIVRDKKTGDSLCYAFIEFENKDSCEEAFFKMDNVLIDDRRIHVDFSQSVAKLHSDFMRGIHTRLEDTSKESYHLVKKTQYRDSSRSQRHDNSFDYVFEHEGKHDYGRSSRKRSRSRSREDHSRYYIKRDDGRRDTREDDRSRDRPRHNSTRERPRDHRRY